MRLYQRSLEIILQGQHASGAYVACPTFPTYQYCWFRDGSYTAYAMDLAGQTASASRFHDWVAQAINRRHAVIEKAVANARQGKTLEGSDVLHTRYTLDGEDGTKQEWPNFQLDGFGAWLWALAQHCQISGETLKPEWRQAAGLAAEYLSALWQHPCYDCWEEHPDKLHPHTLAALYGGLNACQTLEGVACGNTSGEIRRFVLEKALYKGYFVKYLGSYTVDASLLGLAVPYGLVKPDDPRMQATVARIETSLHGGGVHRYPTDTYYGGGEWVLLAAWLGWYYCQAGQPQKAEPILEWIEAQANANGELPEQVAANLIDPHYLEPWQEQWGPSARPLLWSHANTIILYHALDRAS